MMRLLPLDRFLFPAAENQQTLHVSKVPRALHEPAILGGYRPINKPWRYYFASIFHIHNETVNVWTHLLATIVLILVLLDCISDYGSGNKHLWPMVIFLLTCICTCLVSSLVHLLHSKSTDIHYCAFMIDYIGVNTYAFGTGVIAFYSCSDKETYNYFGTYYMPILTIATWFNYITFCSAKLLYGENPYSMRKKLIYITGTLILAVFLSAPFASRYWNCFRSSECSMSSLNHVTLCFPLFIIEAFFFGSHIPEKLIPGKCDIIGQGHQIFHVISTITQLMQIRAVRIDYTIGASDHTHPHLAHLSGATFAVIFLNALTFLYFKKLIGKKQTKNY